MDREGVYTPPDADDSSWDGSWEHLPVPGETGWYPWGPLYDNFKTT